jgi:urease accessory protein
MLITVLITVLITRATTTTTSTSRTSTADTSMSTDVRAAEALEAASARELLSALRLSSPSLPIGAYAYSQGLEQAAAAGLVHDESSALDWISGLLTHAIARFDVPLLLRLYAAWAHGDVGAARRWARLVIAGRESAELQAEERQLGQSLFRLLADTGLAAGGLEHGDATYLGAFALAASSWGMRPRAAALAYAYAWLEHQTSAAVRIVPLGHAAGQRILSRCLGLVPGVVATGEALSDPEIGAFSPGQALSSALHETQYSRLFRS